MSLRNIFPALLVLTFSWSCSQSPISGHITLDDEEKQKQVFLIDPGHFSALASSFEGKVIDSAAIDAEGHFKITKMPDTPQDKIFLLAIQQNGNAYNNKLENDHPDEGNYIPIIYKNGDAVNIESRLKSFTQSAKISGKPDINQEINVLIQTRSELYRKYFSLPTDTDEENLLLKEKALYDFQKELITSSQNSKNILVHALALRWAAPNGDYERIPEFVKQTCAEMTALSPDHPWTVQVCKASSMLPLTKGDTFPDFALPMSDGDTIQLKKMLGTQLTIIDLWASWCAPCRQENRNILVPLWDKYHDQGLQIIGYALDSSHKGWVNAIKKDGADRWLHASHLEGDVSPFMDVLKMSTIPANYVLDADGQVLAKNLHGDELTEWVDQFFKD